MDNPKKQSTWHITRTVQEEYSVQADTELEAIQIVGREGNPFSVTIIKETVKLIPDVG